MTQKHTNTKLTNTNTNIQADKQTNTTNTNLQADWQTNTRLTNTNIQADKETNTTNRFYFLGLISARKVEEVSFPTVHVYPGSIEN